MDNLYFTARRTWAAAISWCSSGWWRGRYAGLAASCSSSSSGIHGWMPGSVTWSSSEPHLSDPLAYLENHEIPVITWSFHYPIRGRKEQTYHSPSTPALKKTLVVPRRYSFWSRLSACSTFSHTTLPSENPWGTTLGAKMVYLCRIS